MSRPPRLVRETAALVLARAGYTADQIRQLLQEHLAPLPLPLLTRELLEQADGMLRGAGFTWHGVGTALQALGDGMPERLPAAAARAAPPPGEQLDLWPS